MLDVERLGLKTADLQTIFKLMLVARRIDERMWLLNRGGEIPFVISCQGKEAIQVGAAFALDKSKDYLFPYYRDLAMVLTYGMTPKEVMLSAYAKADDPNSGGRQMPNHFSSRKRHIITGSSPVTTQVMHAVGFALASKMNHENAVSLVAFGDGSSNQGDFHEAANFAGVHRLPVIFLCENNEYAISTPKSRQYACSRLSDRAVGYGFIGETIDGTDPILVYETVQKAIKRARNGEGPTFIECMAPRLTPHSSDDDDRGYRSEGELESMRLQDPVPKFQRFLEEHHVITNEDVNQMEHSIRQMIDEATEYAKHAKDPDPNQLLNGVYGKEER